MKKESAEIVSSGRLGVRFPAVATLTSPLLTLALRALECTLSPTTDLGSFLFQTFLLVGGFCSVACDPSTFLDTILEFHPGSESWVQREEALGIGTYALGATTVHGEQYCPEP